ncbi:MAG: hypothetical protein GTO45_12195 [Candidatus Aminicenantes bacterium]|nr:hypothetical protein [Candidatus Aminicenantes bacterium]NIM79563.1 hypothetical protein [Candidatus Aminicenantes bacterium]NIN18869.1 hypothetical protein [Candidatus Aminicenantes bacterium]NIN42782.1 hypothetical protein [Candidatus Aminicenantes bacterium]NIN85509.1 hypothetical protein [Candidatus Aminicenantes bacterium]
MKKVFLLVILMVLMVISIFPEEKGKRRFQVELYGGGSWLNPEDLNSRHELYKQSEEFWNDDLYTFAVNNGYISSFDKIREGEFKNMTFALPFGFRLKYFLFESFALSLGFKYVSKSQASDVFYRYTLGLNNGAEIVDTVEYQPLTVSTGGYIPMIGIHVEKKITGSLGVEAYVTGGPLFATCKIGINYFFGETINGNTMEQTGYYQEQKGSGTGYALDGGVRVNIKIRNTIGVFLEGGYALQVVNKLSGPGKHIQDGTTDQWEGDWGLKEYSYSRYWGTIDTVYASNYWQGADQDRWVRGFKLDLSGYQVRIGIFYGF